jgi:hypothetical protein
MFRCGNEPPPAILDPRRLAAIALGEIGDGRAVEPLTEALADENLALRADAERALAKLGRPPVERPEDHPAFTGQLVGWFFNRLVDQAA